MAIAVTPGPEPAEGGRVLADKITVRTRPAMSGTSVLTEPRIVVLIEIRGR